MKEEPKINPLTTECVKVILCSTQTFRSLDNLPLPAVLRLNLLNHWNWKRVRYIYCKKTPHESENVKIDFGKLKDTTFYRVVQLIADFDKRTQFLWKQNILIFHYHYFNWIREECTRCYKMRFNVCGRCANILIKEDEEKDFMQFIDPLNLSFNDKSSIPLIERKMNVASYNLRKNRRMLLDRLIYSSYDWNIWCDNCVTRPLFKIIDYSKFKESDHVAKKNTDFFYEHWISKFNIFSNRTDLSPDTDSGGYITTTSEDGSDEEKYRFKL